MVARLPAGAVRTMTATASAHDYSLQSRLLLGLSILLFVFLGFTGVVLDRAFRNSIEAGAAERLQVQIYLLLAAVEEDNGEFYFLQDLQEPGLANAEPGPEQRRVGYFERQG